MNPRGAALLAALALLAPGASALAGSEALEPPDLERYLRWGFLRVRPGVELSNVGYDDNILLSDQGERVGDYTATVSPRVDGLVLFGHRAFLTFREQLDYTLYVSNSDQNYFNNRGRTRFTLPFRRIGLFADLELNRIKFRPVDREDIRPTLDEQRLGLGVILLPGWRTEVEWTQELADLDYTDRDEDPVDALSISNRLGREESTTRLDGRYRVFGRSRVLGRIELRRVTFAAPFPVETKQIDRDHRQRRALLGMEFGEGGTLVGSFRLGWAQIEADDPLLPSLSEPIGEAELVYRLSSTTRLRFDAYRLPGLAAFGENVYFLESNYGGRVVRYVNRLFGVEAGASWGRLTFPARLTGDGRDDRLLRYDAGIRLRLAENSLGRRVEYSLRVGRYRRDSTDPAVERSQNTVSFGAVLGF